jgi:hypothetical protein
MPAHLDQIRESLSQVTSRTPEMFAASEKMKDRAVGPLVTSTITATACIAGTVLTCMFPPAALAGSLSVTAMAWTGAAISSVPSAISVKSGIHLNVCRKRGSIHIPFIRIPSLWSLIKQ